MAKRDTSYKKMTERADLEKEELKAKIEKLHRETDILDNQIAKQEDERNEIKKRLDKLDKEAKVLDNQLSKKNKWQESIKAYASAASIFTAIFTLFAVYGSFRQISTTAKLTLDSRKEDRLSSALANLADTSVKRRLIGIIALRSFIKEGDSLKNSQALLSLSQTLAIDDNSEIRSSILDVFRSTEIRSVDTMVLKNVLASLLNLNRELVVKSPEIKYLYASDTVGKSVNNILLRVKGVSTAISYLFSQKILSRDLSNLYLQNIDFRGIDMDGTNFSYSSLAYSNFQNVTCKQCVFHEANLMGVDFLAAKLNECRFTAYIGNENFVIKSLKVSSSMARNTFNTINFTGADLRGASFYNFPLLIFKSGASFVFVRPNFYDAKLTNTDFSNSFVGILEDDSDKNSGTFFPIINHVQIFGNKNANVLSGFLVNDILNVPLEKENLDNILFSLQQMYRASNWSQAILPKELKAHLGRVSGH